MSGKINANERMGNKEATFNRFTQAHGQIDQSLLELITACHNVLITALDQAGHSFPIKALLLATIMVQQQEIAQRKQGQPRQHYSSLLSIRNWYSKEENFWK